MRGPIGCFLRRRAFGLAVALGSFGSIWFVQASGAQPPAPATTFGYERATASNALALLEQQVAQAAAPPEVQAWLELGRRHTAQLLSSSDAEEARAHFRAATRAFARISRWLRESESSRGPASQRVSAQGFTPGVQSAPQSRSAAPAPRAASLDARLTRMGRHLDVLASRAQALGLSLDFSAAKQREQSARDALAAGDLAVAERAVSQLQSALEALRGG